MSGVQWAEVSMKFRCSVGGGQYEIRVFSGQSGRRLVSNMSFVLTRLQSCMCSSPETLSHKAVGEY